MKIPLRYINAKYEEVPADIRASFEKIRETRKGLYIHGPVGTGKTHIVYGLANQIIAVRKALELKGNYHGPVCLVHNTTELLDRIRSEFDQKQPEDILSDLKEFEGILMLDDIGSEKMSDWVGERFYTLINRRYEDMRPTIFTSNKSIADLAEHIGDRTTSRIVEMCSIFHLDGKDRRLPKDIHRKGLLTEKTK